MTKFLNQGLFYDEKLQLLKLNTNLINEKVFVCPSFAKP